MTWSSHHIDLVQDCSNSSALAMELLQSCTKPSISSHLISFVMLCCVMLCYVMLYDDIIFCNFIVYIWIFRWVLLHGRQQGKTNSIFLNSLAPEKFEWNFRYVIFKWIFVIAGWGISCEIVLILMSLDFTDDQSTLVQVMAWCHQAWCRQPMLT